MFNFSRAPTEFCSYSVVCNWQKFLWYAVCASLPAVPAAFMHTPSCTHDRQTHDRECSATDRDYITAVLHGIASKRLY